MNEQKDLIGHVHNALTVLEVLSPKNYAGRNYTYVRAKCECGNLIDLCYKDLIKRHSKFCSCKKAKVLVFKGDVYGNWTILSEGKDSYYEDKNARTRTVNAQCICGKKKYNINLSSIVNGMSKSCGCRSWAKKEVKGKIVISIPISTQEESWGKVPEIEGYIISSLGKVFSTKTRQYLTTKNKTALSLRNEGKKGKLNISKTVYRVFIGDWDEKEYSILNIDENIYNSALDNLFLARKDKNGQTWVSKLFALMNSGAKGKHGSRVKIRTITRGNIIRQYFKQEGLSTFLKIKMDLTMTDKLATISVDRIDNDRDYEPDNFTLVTRFENMGRNSSTFDEFNTFVENYVRC
jgi:hypothetical protein